MYGFILKKMAENMADVANAFQVKSTGEHSRLERELPGQGLGRRKCFQCNGNGTCIRCDRTTSQQRSSNCLPLKKHHCTNSAFPWIRANNWLCLVLTHCLPALEFLLDRGIRTFPLAALQSKYPRKY